MSIGNHIARRNFSRNITTVLITIMTQMALWKMVDTATTGRAVQALVLPKLTACRRPPVVGMLNSSNKLSVQLSSPVRSISRSSLVLTRMSIVDDVTAEMKVAMKAKDSVTLGTIRLIRSAFANAAIELRTENLTDEQVHFVH